MSLIDVEVIQIVLTHLNFSLAVFRARPKSASVKFVVSPSWHGQRKRLILH